MTFVRDGDFAVVVHLDCGECADTRAFMAPTGVTPYPGTLGEATDSYLMDVFEDSAPQQSIWLETPGDWSVRLESWNDLPPVTGAQSGTGSTVLQLDGTATSAEVAWTPAGPEDSFQGRYFGVTREASRVFGDTEAFTETFDLKQSKGSRAVLDRLHAGEQEEIRLRARMMASVDEGVGQLLDALERRGQLDDTAIVFLGDNGYFFGEHGLGPERRFAYEEGIRSPFLVRYPRLVRAGSRVKDLVICQDIAPTLLELAGGKPGPQVQGRSLRPLFAGRRAGWRKSFLAEYWAESAMPWLVGMSYKAVRTDRYKYIHWVNRGRDGELDELYDLDRDPYEIKNLNRSKAHAHVRQRLRRELAKLTAAALGL